MRLGLKDMLTRLRRDHRGVSAVEFAFIAPIMILFYFGLCEYSQGFMAQKRVGHIAATIADLVAQDAVIQTTEMNDIFEVAQKLMKPFPTNGLTQRISSVMVDSSGTARVQWSRASGVSQRGTNSTVSLPTGMAARGETVIMTEVTYPYRSPVGYVFPGITNIQRTYYLRPRLVDQITLD